jgi:pimeloyl-ACP methyl ester carboxylesterase
MRILVLHGLWMRAFALRQLARRLQQAGFTPATFDYPSVSGGPEAALPELARRMQRADAVVGHSLGGLMALETLRTHADLPVRRVVCLGSPLRGSGAARTLANAPVAAWTVGKSAELLCRGCEPWAGKAEVGMIAGTKPLGLGGFVARFAEPHDGTVAVSETRLDGLADHVELDASHTGLVFSPRAAALAIPFLRHGRFAA